MGLTGLTSWMCLVDHAHLQAGQRVFINGGSGGTGLWGIQVIYLYISNRVREGHKLRR